jgi:hypothetical protein
MTEEIRNCDNCQQQIDDNGDGGRWSDLTGKEYCWACFESDMEHASTLTYLENGEDAETTKVGSLWIVEGEYYEDVPAEFAATINRSWRASDAWRGHWTTTLSGWVEVAEGLALWGEKTDIVELGARLQEDHIEQVLPCPVMLVADLTSNVFAAGASVFVRESDVDAFRSHYATKEVVQ